MSAVAAFKQKFIGDKKFYSKLIAITVPLMVQNMITNFVSMLDNIMVGRVGTEEMTGVAIVNQLIFVYYLAIFGGLAGAGIFTAQYFGKGDNEGIRNTFRYKVWMGLLITTIAIIIFLTKGQDLIHLYLNEENSVGDIGVALEQGFIYLKIVLIGLPAFFMIQVYAGTMRECGKTVVPMIAGIVAVISNLGLDILLIFGIGPFPRLGVAGAAIATVIARYIEAAIVIIWSHKNADKLPYMQGIYRTMLIPGSMLKEITIKGTPLLFNEFLWSLGMATIMQCYSVRGMEVVAAINIQNTISNMINVMVFAMGDAVAIIVGQHLGANKMKEAKDADNKIIFFAVMLGVVTMLILIALSPVFPLAYNTTEEVRQLASRFIIVQAIFVPQMALLHTSYFTLRSGGKTWLTFVFDSAFIWVIYIPLVYCLSHFTNMEVIWIYVTYNLVEIFKVAFGLVLVHKNIWMVNIT